MGSWPVLAGQSAIFCTSGKGATQGSRESLFMINDQACQKELKILLQKNACFFRGCRGRFNRVGRTVL